ncbi:MAG TPA: D-glucuronyl C5-epimerase family protein [Syntrophales bacterium]
MSNRVAMRSLLLSLGGIALLVGCNDDEVAAPGDPLAAIQGAAHFPYELQDIPENELWDKGYYLVDLAALDTTAFRLDADGVMMVKVVDTFYYNPVTLANYGLALVDDYDQTGEAHYLDSARKFADRMIAEADMFHGAMYFPYDFDWRLHGYPDAADLMKAPWYSGMAQGRALSFFIRLSHETGDDKYLKAADQAFLSFFHPRSAGTPFTVEIDPRGFYWIEEYPHAVPEQVLNGFGYAVRGLYEYYMETRNPDALWITQAALTTLREYVYNYRVPDHYSLYCLAHRLAYLDYHRFAITLTMDMFRISADPYFRTASDLFEADLQAVIAAGSIGGPLDLPIELSDPQWKLPPRQGDFSN